MIAEARQRDQVMMLARGAMAGLVKERFAAWRLTSAESEVALFALKGFDIGEIAMPHCAALPPGRCGRN